MLMHNMFGEKWSTFTFIYSAAEDCFYKVDSLQRGWDGAQKYS